MYILLFILIVIAAAVLIMLITPVKIYFHLDTDEMDMHINAEWTRAILTEIRIINRRLFINVSLFGRKIMSRYLKSKPRPDMIKAMNLRDTRINVRYGLNQPQLTGVFCAAAGLFNSLFSDARVEVIPDFVPVNEFIRVEGETTINTRKTLMSMIKLKFTKRRKIYGTA